MAKMSYPWDMRIGVCSGSTITVLVVNKRQTYTAIGDVVNIAARLQKACVPGKVLIDRYTYESVSLFIEARKKRDIPAKEVLETDKERQMETLTKRSRRNRTTPSPISRSGKSISSSTSRSRPCSISSGP